MKRLEIEQMEVVSGGGNERCSLVAGFITSVGLSAFAVPTPLNIAFGIVVTGVGLLSQYGCP